MLVKFIGEKKESWEDYLDTCVYAYNTSRHESSLYTPFELMFGRKPIIPVDIRNDGIEVLPEYSNIQTGMFNEMYNLVIILLTVAVYNTDFTVIADHRARIFESAKANILKAQKKQKIAYDRKDSNPQTFHLGALVLKKDFTRKKRKGGKLDFKWVGPC